MTRIVLGWMAAVTLAGVLAGCASGHKPRADSDEPKRVCESTLIGTEPKTVCY